MVCKKHFIKLNVVVIFQSDAEQETAKEDVPASPINPAGKKYSL